MKKITYILIASFLVISFTHNVHGNNECSSYTFLNESNRAKTYYNSSIKMCDESLQGWYRFGGEAGKQMADSCVNEGHCGTGLPGWLNGSHPSVADGIVRRKLCFRSPPGQLTDCCRRTAAVDVRNCGSFYVYKLQPPPICNLRYCGNGLPSVSEPTETKGGNKEPKTTQPLAVTSATHQPTMARIQSPKVHSKGMSKTIQHGGSNYTFYGNLVPRPNWEESRQYCQNAGSDLVSIESLKEWVFVKNIILTMKTPEYFIGLKRDGKTNEWRWVNGTPSNRDAFPWAKGEPNGDGKCVVMYKDYRKDYGEYSDLSCTIIRRSGYICESPAEEPTVKTKTAETKGGNKHPTTTQPLAVSSAALQTTMPKTRMTEIHSKGPCPLGWTHYKAYCYLIGSEIKSQSDAKQYCSDRGGDLVKINSVEENEFVLQLVRHKAPSLKQAWIGLERLGNRFYWSDLSVPVYTRWASKEPNGTPKEACCHMWIAGYSSELPQRASGSWNDIACNVSSATPNGLVCKRLP